jgi:VIT1/CCC1 family predicted Fe2+/Mn2+ transporter
MQVKEHHRSDRIGWLRAAVLGANDGIVSTASLVVGVAAAASARQDVLIAGVAGLVAGALSMAAGEYVSVSSQADTEQADLKRERHELATEPQAEEDELTGIYVRRGLDAELARTVARQLMATLASAATFAVGAAVPILAILVAPISALTATVAAASLVCLVVLGATAAFVGGAPMLVGAARVTIWGVVAMLATAAVGRLFGTVVG